MMPRRQVLKAGAALVAAAGVAAVTRGRPAKATTTDPGVPYDGRLTVDSHMIVDRNWTVPGTVQVTPTGVLEWAPGTSATLSASGGVRCAGVVRMRPAAAAVDHALIVTGADDTKFTGGTGPNGDMAVDATDVGLVFICDCTDSICTCPMLFDAAGTPRAPWVRATTDLTAGAVTFTADRDLTGWLPGDLLAVAPTGKGDFTGFEEVTVRAVAGRTVTLSTPLARAHPGYPAGVGVSNGAEILNLTRNVRVEGLPGNGQIHVIWVMANQPSSPSHVGLRYAGPQKIDPATGKKDVILARWGLHLHHCGDGARGTVWDGIVVRDSASRAFVVHGSNGVTVRNCVSYNTAAEAYWWDDHATDDTSTDVTFTGCVAARIASTPSTNSRLCGFQLVIPAVNAAVIGCVAVGVASGIDTAGFVWPEQNPGPAYPPVGWTVTDCVAHNNAGHGFFGWQNTGAANTPTGIVASRNGQWGIKHGAYLTTYRYLNPYVSGNGFGPFAMAGSSTTDYRAPQIIEGGCLDASGQPAALGLLGHRVAGTEPTQLKGVTLTGYTVAAVEWRGPLSSERLPDFTDLLDCSFDAGSLPHVSLTGTDTGGAATKAPAGSVLRQIDGGVVTQTWKA